MLVYWLWRSRCDTPPACGVKREQKAPVLGVCCSRYSPAGEVETSLIKVNRCASCLLGSDPWHRASAPSCWRFNSSIISSWRLFCLTRTLVVVDPGLIRADIHSRDSWEAPTYMTALNKFSFLDFLALLTCSAPQSRGHFSILTLGCTSLPSRVTP